MFCSRLDAVRKQGKFYDWESQNILCMGRADWSKGKAAGDEDTAITHCGQETDAQYSVVDTGTSFLLCSDTIMEGICFVSPYRGLRVTFPEVVFYESMTIRRISGLAVSARPAP